MLRKPEEEKALLAALARLNQDKDCQALLDWMQARVEEIDRAVRRDPQDQAHERGKACGIDEVLQMIKTARERLDSWQ